MAKIKYNQEIFIERAILAHGEKYDYTNSIYVNTRTKLEIICPIHGKFEQLPLDHIRGYGCNKCAIQNKKILKKKSNEVFLSEIKEIHGDRYSTEKTEYNGAFNKITVTCNVHGDFDIEAKSFLNGHGCPDCSYEERSKSNIEKHKNKFLSEPHRFAIVDSSYTNATSPCVATCDIHGDFTVSKAYRLTQDNVSCPSCNISNPESNILDYCISLGVKVIKSYRPKWMNGKELDLFFPDFNFAIEYNGSYWHSDLHKDKWYHFEKSRICKENNIILLHIWEHYWADEVKRKIYESKIKHYLLMDKKIFARKCSFGHLDKKDATLFFRANHLEGFNIPYRESKFIGLFYEGAIIMAASYGKFYNQLSHTFEWKLQRIATLTGHTVVGGISKISKYIKEDVGDFIFQITLDTGGTIFDSVPTKENTSLRYWWVKNKLFLTRNSTQISALKKKIDWKNDDTENSYMRRNGFLKIWDSGILEV